MMFLVEDAKVIRYLLVSPSKAPFFLHAGYTLADWEKLRDDLQKHPLVAQHEATEANSYGTKTRYRCAMPIAPNGKQYCVRTIWQQQPNGTWRFVTA
jgi:hypothetical protein